MKSLESSRGSDATFAELVNTAVGALTTNVVANLVGRPHSATKGGRHG